MRWGVLTTARIAQDRFLPAMQKARNADRLGDQQPQRARSARSLTRFGIPAVYSIP